MPGCRSNTSIEQFARSGLDSCRILDKGWAARMRRLRTSIPLSTYLHLHVSMCISERSLSSQSVFLIMTRRVRTVSWSVGSSYSNACPGCRRLLPLLVPIPALLICDQIRELRVARVLPRLRISDISTPFTRSVPGDPPHCEKSEAAEHVERHLQEAAAIEGASPLKVAGRRTPGKEGQP